MRKFTKEHNDLLWLFPICDNETSASKLFDEVESTAEYLLNICYGCDDKCDENIFTRDDMIDAFMKGYSQATQSCVNEIRSLRIADKDNERMSELNNVIEKLAEIINKI